MYFDTSLKRPLPRLLLAHLMASLLFYPLSMGLLPLLRPAFAGRILPGLYMWNAVLMAPVSTPALLIINTVTEIQGPYPTFPSNRWLWPNYLLPLALCYTLLSRPYWQKAKRLQRIAQQRCPACGYDVRATPDRCPECGANPSK